MEEVGACFTQFIVSSLDRGTKLSLNSDCGKETCGGCLQLFSSYGNGPATAESGRKLFASCFTFSLVSSDEGATVVVAEAAAFVY
jgi:hypothetical protein